MVYSWVEPSSRSRKRTRDLFVVTSGGIRSEGTITALVNSPDQVGVTAIFNLRSSNNVLQPLAVLR
jgi:hypothetical protein